MDDGMDHKPHDGTRQTGLSFGLVIGGGVLVTIAVGLVVWLILTSRAATAAKLEADARAAAVKLAADQAAKTAAAKLAAEQAVAKAAAEKRVADESLARTAAALAAAEENLRQARDANEQTAAKADADRAAADKAAADRLQAESKDKAAADSGGGSRTPATTAADLTAFGAIKDATMDVRGYTGSQQWTDVSGYGNHATLVGGPPEVVTHGGGYLTPANQKDKWIQFHPKALQALPTNEWTLTTWLEPLSLPLGAQARYLHNMTSSITQNPNTFLVECLSNGTLRLFSRTRTTEYQEDIVCKPGVPLMLTIRRVKNLYYFHKDGRLVSAYHAAANEEDSSKVVHWNANQEYDGGEGFGFDPAQAMHANWYRVWLVPRAMTPVEITTAFEADRRRFGL